MQRRKLLAAMGSAAAATGAAMGTGAFTSVQANRSVSVSVADDADALLAFETGSAGPNSAYAEGVGDGTLEIDIGNADGDGATSEGATGINQDATTIIRDMFDIRNQGTQAVFAYVDSRPDGFGLFSDFPAHAEPTTAGTRRNPDAAPQSGPAEPTTGLNESSGTSVPITGGGSIDISIPERVYLEPGDALREVGTAFSGSDIEDVSGELTISAVAVDATEAEVNTNPADQPDYVVDVEL